MKVVTAKEMARIEKLAYDAGASEEQFMEKAGSGVAERVRRLLAKLHIKPKILLLCGKGNNGGDAFVAGRHLLGSDFEVSAIALSSKSECGPLAELQITRFENLGGKIIWAKKIEDVDFEDVHILVDGIFGTGFRGKVEGLYRDAIEKANDSKLPILAIDIPSGINGNTGEMGDVCIHATETIFLGLPKTGCFLSDAWNHVGHVHVYNFGLKKEFIDQAKENFILLEESFVSSLLPKIVRTRHKYDAGYVVGVGGSLGMPGAAILSSFAALRAGAGILRLFHPQGMEEELSGAPVEIIRGGYKKGDISQILEEMKRAKGVFIGPGISVSEDAAELLKALLPQVEKPVVIDAEALTLIAKHSFSFPPKTVITPHHGEMKRLLKSEKEIPFPQFLEECQRYVEEKKVTLVLKGAPTFILHPQIPPHICPRGDPGMATAGSGDVLTGIIAAFLAQGKSPLEAAQLGVYLHALSGEIAAEALTSYSMVASDITHYLPRAFKKLLL